MLFSLLFFFCIVTRILSVCSAFKARGNANNDWDVSLNLIKESGCLADAKIPSREDVIRVFEELYV
jgi:hypothetical protein